MDKSFLRLHSIDNVFITTRRIEKDEVIPFNGVDYVLTNAIPQFFKVSARDINKGEKIIKCGVSIGFATKHIAVGEMVHTHNMNSDFTTSFTGNN